MVHHTRALHQGNMKEHKQMHTMRDNMFFLDIFEGASSRNETSSGEPE
jgi:hypothetical protein